MELTVRDVPSMFSEMMILMSMSGQPECSRNGEVLTIQEPLTVTVKNPLNRVLIDPVRQANPYFHVMEFIWMMAGNNQPNWIKAFNSRFEDYADNLNSKGVDIIHGAYGHRWRNHFNLDQIHAAVDMLEYNPESRRVVLSMWDTNADLGKAHNDLPCNTHIYLRVVDGKLNMTVCNRSNDVVWGMTGANAVHMTMLHELISLAAHIPIGKYIVVTNNAHFYTSLPNAEELLNVRYPTLPNDKNFGFYENVPLLSSGEHMVDFFEDAVDFINGAPRQYKFKCEWFNNVGRPMYWAYMERLRGRSGDDFIEEIQDLNWRTACKRWGVWKS